MWRKELWHPMVVHFPIALLLLAALVGIFLLFSTNKENGPFLVRSFSWLLGIGTAMAWLAIYTGLWSYNTEVRRICDPDVLKSHLWWGYCAAILYTVGLGLYKLRHLVPFKRLFALLAIIFVLGGAGALVYTGHLGASLVYQQGAGVRQPAADCGEFRR
ncbi:DUF2231 domain-containing protein [Parapedobacter koreensis]|nr:DUF2231 domain-containing protein [Parapedobacter koreensis]